MPTRIISDFILVGFSRAGSDLFSIGPDFEMKAISILKSCPYLISAIYYGNLLFITQFGGSAATVMKNYFV